MKTGGQLLRQQMNPFYAGNFGRTGFIRFSGQYNGGTERFFSDFESACRKLTSSSVFESRAGRGVRTPEAGGTENSHSSGFYIQDDWRATDSLTLNLGLRWEYHSPLVEVRDRQTNFEPFTGRQLFAG